MPRPKNHAGHEPPLVAELRSAIADSGASHYALAKKAGIDEAGVRKFVIRERSLSLDSAARIAEALGLKLTRPARPRKFPKPPRATRPARPEDARSVFEVVEASAEEAGGSEAETDTPPRPDPDRGGA